MRRQDNMPAVGAALIAALLFGLATPAARFFGGTFSPHMLAALFYLGSGLGLSVWRLAARGEAAAPLTRRDKLVLAGAILAGGVLAPPLQLYGLQRTLASTASLLLNLEAVFTALLAWLVVGEHVHARTFWGMVLIVAGSVCLSWSGPIEVRSVVGPLAVALACLLWGIDNNLTQQVSGTDPVRIAAAKGLVAGSVNMVLALALGAPVPQLDHAGMAMLVGLAGYGISLVLFVRGLRELGTARTGACFSLAPFVGAAASLVVWNEPVTALFVAAVALMGAGLWLHITEHHEHRHRHEPLTHSHEHAHDEHHRHAHQEGDPPGEPHTHAHTHALLEHSHAHYPDIHHRHDHPGC